MSEEAATQFYTLVFETVQALLAPFLAFAQYDSSLFWPFLASTLAIAVVVYGVWGAWARRSRFSPLGFLRGFFSRAVWWHRSSRADYRFYLVNGILFPAIVGPLILSGAQIGEGVRDGLTSLFGAPASPAEVGFAATLAFSAAFFLAYDLGRYIAHSVLHEVPLLWQFHKVHHSAEVLTPFTSFRVHPLDLFIMAMGANLLTGPVTGLFLYFFAGDISLVTFFGLHVVIFAYNLVGNLRHTHVWLSYGRLGYVFVSPAQHQIHHSALVHHFGKNRGFGLAIWDLAFGTLYVPKEREEFPMGLGDGSDGEWHTVARMYWWPFSQSFALLRQRVRGSP